MALTSEIITLSTTRKKVVDGTLVPATGGFCRLAEASAAVLVGGASVTTANGQTLAITSGVIEIPLSPGCDVYVIASSGTPTVRVLATAGGLTTAGLQANG